MSSPRQPSVDRSKYLLLSPGGAKVLSAVAIGGMYLWFALKFFLSGDQPELRLVVGLSGLVGVIGSIVVFFCTYGFVANAPDKYLDEREVQDRNAAYLQAYIYAVAMLLIGCIGSDLIGKTYSTFEVTPAVIANFLTVAFFTCLIMPATILAWRDRADDSQL